MTIAAHRKITLDNELSQLCGIVFDQEAIIQGGEISKDLLKKYTRQIARVGLAAGDEGLLGLHDVCVQIHSNLMNLLNNEGELNLNIQVFVLQIPDLIVSY